MTTQQAQSYTQKWVWYGAVASAMILAVAMVLLAIGEHGIGYNSDSFSYMLGAEKLIEEGLLTTEYSLVHFPPLLPLLLIGIGVDNATLLLVFSLLLLIANIATFAWMLHIAHVNPYLQIGVILLVGVSPVMLILHGILHSEPLFLLLLQLSIIFLAKGQFRLALLCVALAPLQRYAGVALVGAAALIVWYRVGFVRAVVFGAFGITPLALWMLRSAVIADNPGREFGFRWMGWDRLVDAGITLAPWLLPMLVVCVGLFMLTQQRPKTPEIVRMSAIFTVVYSAFLILSINFFDHFTPLDFRILSPVILLGWFMVAWFIDAQLATLKAQDWRLFSRPLYMWVSIGLVLMVVCYVGIGSAYAITRRPDGLGMVRALEPIHWEVLATVPENTLIYSNQEHLIAIMGREAISPPGNVYQSWDDAQYEIGMAQMIEEIEAGQAVIFWFEDFPRSQLASPDELATLTPQNAYYDGLIVFST